MSRAAKLLSSGREFRDGLVFKFLEDEIYPIRILNKEARDSITYQFHNRNRPLPPYLHHPGAVLKDGQWFTLIFNKKDMYEIIEGTIRAAEEDMRLQLEDVDPNGEIEFTKHERDEAILNFLHKKVFQYINSRFYISFIEVLTDKIYITFECNKVSRSSKKSVIDIEYVRKNINKALSELNKYYRFEWSSIPLEDSVRRHFELLDVIHEVDIRKMGKKTKNTKKHKKTRRLTTKNATFKKSSVKTH